MDLRLKTRIAEGLIQIEVGGELELHNAPQLRAELSRACEGVAPRVLIDLSSLSFVDSTGIGVLVGGFKKAREAGGNMAFVCPQPRVRRVFEIAGLMRALPILETRSEAENVLKSGANSNGAAASSTAVAVRETTSAPMGHAVVESAADQGRDNA